MKFICRDFKLIFFEIKSLFFCLIKRTKNQGFGIVVKAQISIFFEIFATMRFFLFAPKNADFVGDLLNSFRQKSSISVRSQNPKIPRPKVILNWELGCFSLRVYFFLIRHYIITKKVSRILGHPLNLCNS